MYNIVFNFSIIYILLFLIFLLFLLFIYIYSYIYSGKLIIYVHKDIKRKYVATQRTYVNSCHLQFDLARKNSFLGVFTEYKVRESHSQRTLV